MVNDDVLYLTVEELAAEIKAKKLSPVELAKAYLERLEKYGPRLGAVATLTPELALEQAREAEDHIMRGKYRGPLHGVPYGAKDLLATKGIPTTWGAPPFRDQVFDYDATIVRKLQEAGAVLVAKLAMIELAGGGGYSSAAASLQGPSRCPYNTDHWAGGSSSGPGAAVPPALVGFAIGSETLGSIITPAAFSGVSGFRPTYGRVSRHGAMALSWTMDKLGPMCRSAADCALVLEAIAGHDPQDLSSVAGSEFRYREGRLGRALRAPARLFGKGRSGDLRGLRIGVFQPDLSRGGDQEVVQAYAVAIETLRGLGALLEETELPDLPYGPVASALIAAEGATIFRPLIESGQVQELVDERQKAGLIASLSLQVTDYLDACRIRAQIQAEVAKVFEKYDALVAPSRTTPASRIDADLQAPPPPRPEGERALQPAPGDRRNLLGASNVAGLPAISVPCGFTQKNLPIGIQCVANAMRDDVCIEIAVAYQSATDWHRRRPQL